MITKLKLFEIADEINIKNENIYLTHSDDDAYPFGVDGVVRKGKIDISDVFVGNQGSTHSEITDDNIPTLVNLYYTGRIWTESKIISFWNYPETQKILRQIFDLMNDEFDDIFNYSEWRIEILTDEKNEICELIPIEDFKNSNNPSEKTKNLHIMDSEEKNRELMKSGYRGKTSKWKKYMKPFEKFSNINIEEVDKKNKS